MESKNDYEYLAFEDMKPAGCEPVALRSGGKMGLGVYSNMELRDQKVRSSSPRCRRDADSDLSPARGDPGRVPRPADQRLCHVRAGHPLPLQEMQLGIRDTAPARPVTARRIPSTHSTR